MTPGVTQTFSSMQTKLSLTTKKFLDNIKKYEKRIAIKKKHEYASMKSILLPVGQTKLSKPGKQILSKIIDDNEVDSEDEDKISMLKETKSLNYIRIKRDVCELAKSITNKMADFRIKTRKLKPAKTLPYFFKNAREVK